MEGRTEAHPISPFLNFVETWDNTRGISQHEKLSGNLQKNLSRRFGYGSANLYETKIFLVGLKELV